MKKIFLSLPLVLCVYQAKAEYVGTQNQLMVLEGLSKIVRIPYFAVKKAVEVARKSHNSYEKDFFRSTKFDPTKVPSVAFAYHTNYTPTRKLVDISDLIKGEDHSDKSCAEICPNSFEIFRLQTEQLRVTKENFLSFRNLAEDFSDSWEKQSGYCWGHSTVLDDFHYLAFFDPRNTSQAVIPDAINQREEYVNFYKKLIDRVVKKTKATVIPGFKNLRELSEVPELKLYLKKRVAFKWAKNAVKLRSIGNLTLDGKKMSLERTQKFILETAKRLQSHQTPRIIFAAQGDSTYSHVLNIVGLNVLLDGTTRLYVMETNFFPEDVGPLAHYIDIDKLGNATYKPLINSRIKHDRLGKIKFSFEEELSTVEYVRALERFCRKQTNCR